MNWTEAYYSSAADYRSQLRTIWGDFEKRQAALEPYAGSDGYQRELADAVAQRDAAIDDLQGRTMGDLTAAVGAMRRNAVSRIMTPPTQEQLALLTALKMREKLSRDELEQAGRSLQTCPVAVGVLAEIAAAQGSPNLFSGLGVESTASIMAHCDQLLDSAKRLCALRRCDTKRDMVARADTNSPLWTSDALYSFRVDRDVSTEAEALRFYGGVADAAAFRAAVNN